jgi:hypothetical protein
MRFVTLLVSDKAAQYKLTASLWHRLYHALPDHGSSHTDLPTAAAVP